MPALAEDFLRHLDTFTTTPPRPPEDARQYRYAICACARWETPYVVEWLNYYRALGFDHVYLYCNDDDPAALYAQVLPFTQGPTPFVTFRYHPYQGQQSQMYNHFLRHGLAQTQWVSFFDLDEFLRLPPGETIAQFMVRFPAETDCVLFNWIFFGPNGHKYSPAGYVLENFTQREDAIHPLTKFVCRAQALTGEKPREKEDYPFWHCPNAYAEAEIHTVNVLGEDMRRYYEDFPERAKAYVNAPVRKEHLLATAMIHHYAFRSENAFMERAERGLGGNFQGQITWRDHAQGPDFERLLRLFNAVTDTRLARFWPDLLQTAWNTSTLSQTKALPLSRGKSTRQSSYLNDPEFPAHAADGQGATSGVRNGVRKFHTDFEENPWWQVDLGGFATIREIHIYNTNDHTAVRFCNFILSVSIDGITWVELTRKADKAVVGGVTGSPFIWDGPGTAWARHVRVTLLGRDYLHLDQVEVFGQMD
ncbi:MAG TPA: glycosyltransferase family 2 protein [Acidocella sp.]|nr:glycosyltransferase family 2 protein [Acidocella sp.]